MGYKRLITNPSRPAIVNVLKAIADDKALTLLNSIAILGEDEGCIPSIKEMNLDYQAILFKNRRFKES